MSLDDESMKGSLPATQWPWVLEVLPTPVAIFAPQGWLRVWNQAWVNVWRLDADWLTTHPTVEEVFEAIARGGYWTSTQLETLRQAAVELKAARVVNLLQRNGVYLSLSLMPTPDGGLLLTLQPPWMSDDVGDRASPVPPVKPGSTMPVTNAEPISLAEAELQTQESQEMDERWQLVWHSTHDGMWDWNLKTNQLFFSEPWQSVLGYAAADMPIDAQHWLSLIHPLDLDRLTQTLHDYLNHKTPVFACEYRLRCPDKHYKWVLARGKGLWDDSGTARRIAGSLTDIGDRKAQENRLRLLESVVVNARESILITEAEPIELPGPRILYVNKAFSEMTGYSPKDVLGKTPRLLQGPKTNRATLDRLRTALLNWQPVMVELLNYRKDGTEFWVEMSIVPVSDQTGYYTHWIAIQREITQRKQLEHELLKTLQTEKELSELKSRIVAMTSHEFRTPLTSILSASELLEHYGDTWSKAERTEQLHVIQSMVQHMIQLIEDTLLIGKAESRQLKPQLVKLDAGELAQAIARELQRGIGHQHHLHVVCPPQMPEVYLDRKLLRQILTNLIANAVKYSAVGSAIWLEVAYTPPQLQISVRDEGIGIPPEDQKNLFEFFYRGRNVGTTPGTGLGLAIVKKCVDVCEGTISCVSEIGQGTTMQVVLPAPVSL